MLRKMMLTLFTGAAIGAAVLAPSVASAKPWGFGGGWHGGWYGGPRVFGLYAGPVYSGCIVRRWVATPYGPRLRWVNICY